MSTASQYRALVVDDEPSVCQATMRALSRAEFVCDSAPNGRVAMEMAKQTCYELVVTDLRMPEANGHQFAVALLEMPSRPAIVILTGVMEPKLSNDLRIRGVDEILFKPVSYDVLADKTRKIVDHRRTMQALGNSLSNAENQSANISPNEAKPTTPAKPIYSQIVKSAHGLRTPPKNFDGFAKASSNAFNSSDLANAIKSDPSFADEVLSFANRLLYKSHHAFNELQSSVRTFEQNAIVRAIMIFAAGALVGWLFSWLGTGDGLFR